MYVLVHAVLSDGVTASAGRSRDSITVPTVGRVKRERGCTAVWVSDRRRAVDFGPRVGRDAGQL
jgi:hypothetical protein